MLTLGDASVRSVNVVQMIEVTFARGAGVDGDPVREVTQFWTMNGDMLLEKDDYIIERLKNRPKGNDPTE